MKINKQKLFMILLSSTLTFASLGCENKDVNDKTQKIVEDKIEENETQEQIKETQQEENYREEDVIRYFEEIENEIYEDLTKEDGVFDTVKEKCAYFVLFMSNEKEIKGYTWSELTEETKEKIVEIFLNVDEKMCEKYPDYMQKIKEYSKKASVFVTDTYESIKEKANTIIDENIDEQTQEDVSNSFKDGYEDLKDSLNKGLEMVKKWARSNS